MYPNFSKLGGAPRLCCMCALAVLGLPRVFPILSRPVPTGPLAGLGLGTPLYVPSASVLPTLVPAVARLLFTDAVMGRLCLDGDRLGPAVAGRRRPGFASAGFFPFRVRNVWRLSCCTRHLAFADFSWSANPSRDWKS